MLVIRISVAFKMSYEMINPTVETRETVTLTKTAYSRKLRLKFKMAAVEKMMLGYGWVHFLKMVLQMFLSKEGVAATHRHMFARYGMLCGRMMVAIRVLYSPVSTDFPSFNPERIWHTAYPALSWNLFGLMFLPDVYPRKRLATVHGALVLSI